MDCDQHFLNCALYIQKTIRENICRGKKDATDEELEAACLAAQAHGFIMNFPDAYEAALEQGGYPPSVNKTSRKCEKKT